MHKFSNSDDLTLFIVQIDDCLNHESATGGLCADGINDLSCMCREGYNRKMSDW